MQKEGTDPGSFGDDMVKQAFAALSAGEEFAKEAFPPCSGRCPREPMPTRPLSKLGLEAMDQGDAVQVIVRRTHS